MKIRNYKNRDFSNQFNHLTLMDIIRERKQNIKESTIIRTKPIKFNSLQEDFIPRMMELDPITPNRYVWHVTEHRRNTNHDLTRYSIATEGLKCDCSEFKVIFANNDLSLLKEFYPFMFEFMFQWDSQQPLNKIDLTPARVVIDSDFWRIDTHAVHTKWWIDPNMKAEGFGNNDRNCLCNKNYICTMMDIPPHALRLYKVKLNVYSSKLSHNLVSESSVFPISLLTPDERVDYLLTRNKRAA